MASQSKLQPFADLVNDAKLSRVTPSPLVNGQPANVAASRVPPPTASTMGRTMVGTLPSEMQLDADFAENQYGGQVPVYRLMPPASSGKTAVNAAIQSAQTAVQQGGGGSGPTLETNGVPNSKQTLLNLQSGANIELTPDSNGNVRIDAGSSSGFTLLPEGTATSIQNFDSNPLTFEASYWNGSSPAIDLWSIQLFPGSNPLSSGTDLEINHSTLNGAGRFHINSDMLIGPPLSATSSQNSNSFAWDVEGSYWDGTQTQFAIWEQALGIVPASGDAGLNARLSMYPLFTGAVGTGDIAIGGTGVNPLQGYPVAHPYWILKAFPVSDGQTATLQHTGFTADRTFTFPDATGTLATLENAQTFSALNTFSAGLAASFIESTSANPATVGVVELAVGDVISWRNNANSGNLRLGVDAGDNLELVGGFNGINLKGNNLSQVTNLQSDSANIATSGFVLMAASDAIAWRNAANSADLLLAKDSSDRLTFGGNTVAAPVYNAAGTLQNAAHVVQDTVTLVGGTATVTLSGSAAFSSATSYTCTANDQTAANPVRIIQNSGSSITFTGTGTDVIRFIAIGN